VRGGHPRRNTFQPCQRQASPGHAFCCPATGQCTPRRCQQNALCQIHGVFHSIHPPHMMHHSAAQRPATKALLLKRLLLSCTTVHRNDLDEYHAAMRTDRFVSYCNIFYCTGALHTLYATVLHWKAAVVVLTPLPLILLLTKLPKYTSLSVQTYLP